MDDNKRNIVYFEDSSMKELYETMDEWQKKNLKRFHSMDIQRDGNTFCCIALTNPTEVVIVSGNGGEQQADVYEGHLRTTHLVR